MKYHCFLKGPSITIIEKIAFFSLFQLSASVAASFFFARQMAFCTVPFVMWSILMAAFMPTETLEQVAPDGFWGLRQRPRLVIIRADFGLPCPTASSFFRIDPLK